MEFNVLIVDDEFIFHEIIKMMLYPLENLKIFTATTGKEALQIASEKVIDIFIIDICLLSMDGIELLREIRKTYQDEPIIIESFIDDAEIKAMIHDEFEIVAFLTKPFSKEKLLEKVNRALRRIGSTKEKYITLYAFRRNTYSFEVKTILYIEKLKNTKNINVIIFDRVQSILKTICIKRISLEDVLAQIEDEETLCRCHNSFIINVKKIKEIDCKNNLVNLYNTDQEIPIGRVYRKNILELRRILYSS